MSSHRRPTGAVSAFAGLTLVLAISTPVLARGVVVDTGSVSWSAFTACDVEGPCVPRTLDFEMRLPGVTTNQIYVYSNGLISIGAPLVFPSSGVISSLADLAGQNVITSEYHNDVDPLGPFTVLPSLPAEDLVYDAYDVDGQPFPSEIVITPLNSAGAFSLTFRQGDSDGSIPTFAAGTMVGYQFGGLNNDFIGGPVDDVTLDFGFGVPEPTSWALMVTGLGILGVGLRLAKRSGGAIRA